MPGVLFVARPPQSSFDSTLRPCQVRAWTYPASTCSPCSPRTSATSSGTRARSPRPPATRASSGPCSTRPSFCHTTRYDGEKHAEKACPNWKWSYWFHFLLPSLCCTQIRKLEGTLMDLDNKTLWNDYRIAQPLNDRVVESSFLPRFGKGSAWWRDNHRFLRNRVNVQS